MLGTFSARAFYLFQITVEQGPTMLAVGAGRGVPLSFIISFLILFVDGWIKIEILFERAVRSQTLKSKMILVPVSRWWIYQDHARSLHRE